MKLKIPKRTYDRFTAEQLDILETNFVFSEKSGAWYSRINPYRESVSKTEQANLTAAVIRLDVFPTIFYLPTREEYASLTGEQKDLLHKYFEWNPKAVGFESRTGLERGANIFVRLGSDPFTSEWSVELLERINEHQVLPGVCTYSLETSMDGMINRGITEIKNGKQFMKLLDSVSRFTQYSAPNMMLLAFQNPDATLVASKDTWHRHGRYLNDDARGALIFAPIRGKNVCFGAATDEKRRVLTLTPVKVYDISETHGNPLQRPQEELFTEEGERFYAIKEAISAAAAPFKIDFSENIPESTAGYCDYYNKTIWCSNALSPANTIKTLFQQLASAKLYEASDIVTTRNLQPESIAYMCCKHFRIDQASYVDQTFPELEFWRPSSATETAEVLESAINQVRKICTAVEQDLAPRLVAIREMEAEEAAARSTAAAPEAAPETGQNLQNP